MRRTRPPWLPQWALITARTGSALTQAAGDLFDVGVWTAALEKYGAVTGLSVGVYDCGARLVCDPLPATPLFSALRAHGDHQRWFAECAEVCLAQDAAHRPTIVALPVTGLALVGTSIAFDGAVVGAAVAGYAIVDFPQAPVIERLARAAGIPFRDLWDIARRQQPVPERRLLLLGELLQVLGDTIFRGRERTRALEHTAEELASIAMAKDEFLAVLSHELRTPLTPILGWARILKTTRDPARVMQAADTIERNAMFQVRLVEDLLEFNRAIRGKVTLKCENRDLRDVLRMSLEAISEAAVQKGVLIDVAASAGDMVVHADADRLQQIFRNILSNALKFTPHGGAVSVTLTQQGDQAVVTTADTGEGIAPEFLPFVFEMFRQQEDGTRRKHPGLGIGLALVKSLTELHGGTVSIASAGAGHGTQVTVRLALAHQPAAPEPAAEAPLRPQAIAGLRILLIDDTNDARDATCEMLADLGAEVVVAGDGVEGLDRMRQAGPAFDLVFCNLRMPRMDGFDFLSQLRLDRDGRHPPVIAMSGLAGADDHARTQESGFAAHLDKPFDDAALLAAASAVLEPGRS